MIIVDTSIWADFFRGGEQRLRQLSADNQILQHPFVTGEIGMGSFPDQRIRAQTVRTLSALSQAAVCDDSVFHEFVAEHGLNGSGLGFVDAHLLASASLTEGAHLWTRDKRLAAQAERLDLAWTG